MVKETVLTVLILVTVVTVLRLLTIVTEVTVVAVVSMKEVTEVTVKDLPTRILKYINKNIQNYTTQNISSKLPRKLYKIENILNRESKR